MDIKETLKSGATAAALYVGSLNPVSAQTVDYVENIVGSCGTNAAET